ncbi:MAG: ABC transporter permease [Pseudomonadota bacterium]
MAGPDLMPSFINLRVIFALMMREMSTRYGRSAGGYIWAIIEPVGMIAVMSIVFGFVLRTPALGSNFPLFFATGFLPFSYYMELANFSSSAVGMNRPLLTYPRVTPMDTVIARVALQFITLCVVSVLILGGIIIFYDIHTVYDFSSMIEGVALASLLGFGNGVTNAVIISYVPTYMNVWKILTRPLFLISGVFFIPDELPRVARDLLWYNPISHAVGLVRRGFYPTYEADWISHLYLGGTAVGLTTVGLFLIYYNRHNIVEEK